MRERARRRAFACGLGFATVLPSALLLWVEPSLSIAVVNGMVAAFGLGMYLGARDRPVVWRRPPRSLTLEIPPEDIGHG